MNKPVAWMMVNRENTSAYLTFDKPTRDMKISHEPHELYIHPVKELTPLTEDECRAIIEKHNWFAKSWAEMAMEIQDAILRKAQEK
jgi:hypothetical protein